MANVVQFVQVCDCEPAEARRRGESPEQAAYVIKHHMMEGLNYCAAYLQAATGRRWDREVKWKVGPAKVTLDATLRPAGPHVPTDREMAVFESVLAHPPEWLEPIQTQVRAALLEPTTAPV